MKIALMYLIVNCQRQLQYRVSFFGYLILTFIVSAAQFLFFSRLFDFARDLGGYRASDLFLMLYVSISVLLCVEFIGASINKFFDKVYHGGIEPYLTKPVPALLQALLAWCSPVNLLILALLNLFVILSPLQIEVQADVWNWLGFGVAAVCAVACNVGFLLLMNFATFVIQRKMPVEYVHSKVYEISVVPVELMPQKAFRAAVMVLPIAFSASVPVSVLVKGRFDTLAWLGAATVLIVNGAVIGFRALAQKFEGLGG